MRAVKSGAWAAIIAEVVVGLTSAAGWGAAQAYSAQFSDVEFDGVVACSFGVGVFAPRSAARANE